VRRQWDVLVGVIAIAALPEILGAQGVVTGVVTERYVFHAPANAGLSRVEVRWIPFGAGVTLSSWLSSTITGGLARGSVTTPGGAEATLEGLAATRVELDLGLPGGALALGAWALVPGTYESESAAGARMMGVLATELLPFGAEPWGAGPGFGARVSAAADLPGLDLQVEGGYCVRDGGEFPGDADLVYRPGAEIHARVLGDVMLGRTSTLSAQLGFQRFGSDMVDHRNVFQSGTRLEGLVAIAFPLNLTGSARLYAGLRHRGAGADGPSVDWLPGITNAPVRQLALSGFDVRIPWGRGAVLSDAGIRVLRSRGGPCLLSKDADVAYERTCPSGQGWMVSTGLAVELPLVGSGGLSHVTIVPFGRIHAGEVVDWALREAEDGGAGRGHRTSSVRGWQVGLGVRAGP
jgi:hypothetical protein